MFSKIIIVQDIITKEQAISIKGILHDFFQNTFLPKISNLSRPLDKKYGNFIERHLGRFEIIPPDDIVNSIWNILFNGFVEENNVFGKVNQIIQSEIQYNNPLSEKCIKELGILPIEPHTKNGYWHRDVYFREPSYYQRKPFYITQVIYLDNLANTEFCINSRHNSNNNYTKYDKKVICAQPLSSVIFDGRHLHRGLANLTDETRYALYISYYDSSYVDREHLADPFLFT